MKQYIVACFLMLLSAQAYGEAAIYPVDTLAYTGPTGSRINVVFVGDGYREEELDQFIIDARNVMERFFAISPFAEYVSYFNVFAIRTPSEESGASHPGNAVDETGSVPIQEVRTIFSSQFDVRLIHRLLVPLDKSAVFETLADNLPEYDQAIVLVNSPHYGGSGGQLATASTHPSSAEIVLHEIGHSFAYLVDEYSSSGGTPREGPNTTAETNREAIKWNAWIEDTTPTPTPNDGQYRDDVGLFEGAAYASTGWYRPQQFCKMRTLGLEFCAVCKQEVAETIFDLVNPIDRYFPEEVQLTAGDRPIEFGVELLQPNPNTLQTTWILNTDTVARQGTSVIITPQDLAIGANRLTVAVLDTTGLTRSDDHKVVHLYTARWTIGYSPTSIDAAGATNSIFFEVGPNPFKDILYIRYGLEATAFVELSVIDAQGRRIRTPVRKAQSSGYHEITLDSILSGIPAGVYFIQLVIDGAAVTHKIVKSG